MSNLFQKLELEAFRAGINPRTKESREWFRQRVQKMRRINRDRLMKDESLDETSQFIPGGMYMFFYDPKHKETLPYYDTFPLVIAVGPAEKGFYGINLHYLAPVLRAKLLDSLLDVINNSKYDKTTKFKISYDLLKRTQKFKYFKPCFKHYLTEHVKSDFAQVFAPEWEIATFLPAQSFQKKTANQVYNLSRIQL